MKFEKIHIIVNLKSGHDEPILSYLEEAFQESGIEWAVSIIKKEKDAKAFAMQWFDKVDVIAIYGGDGSVAEVAQVLKGSDTVLAIIPGGTANVISKELGIPQDTRKAIELLKSLQTEWIQMDMGSANDCLFMIRVNLGIMADMVIDATRKLKNQVGQLAYGIAAIQSMAKTDPVVYKMKIDGVEISEEGVALTVTNCGNVGIGDFSFLPDISIVDGFLDVILLKQADLMSILRIAGTTFMKTESDVWKHWICKEIEITLESTQKIIVDDCEKEAKYLHIKIIPSILKVMVPLKITT